MSSYVKAELRNIGRKKRKLQNEEESETSSSGVEENETSTLCKEDSGERRSSFLRSSSSNECKTTSNSEKVDDSTDTNYSDKRFRDGREGSLSGHSMAIRRFKEHQHFLQ